MAAFKDNKVPPPHIPVRPQTEAIEFQYEMQRSARSQKIEDKIEGIEMFLLGGLKTHDLEELGDTFELLTNLRSIVSYELLTADEENRLAEDITDLKDQLDGGVLKIADIPHHLTQLMTHLEEQTPKAKILNLMQHLKSLLHYSPKMGLPPMEEKEFHEITEPIYSFLKNDLTKFQIESVAKKLLTIFQEFNENPRANLSITLERIQQLGKDILSGLI